MPTLGFLLPAARRLWLACACLAAWACAGAAGVQSRYTSIAESECKPVTGTIKTGFEVRGLSAQECSGLDRWRVYAVSSDERSWLEIARDEKLWSTEQQVAYDNAIGHFPNLGSGKAEWRLIGSEPYALIFRVFAQDPVRQGQAGAATVSRLFVVRLDGRPVPQFCGVVSDNRAARDLADDAARCRIPLQERPLP